MGQITATRNLLATKVVRLAGQIAWLFPCHRHQMGFSLECPGLLARLNALTGSIHDDVIKWKHFPRH